jgi:hypothetical protein
MEEYFKNGRRSGRTTRAIDGYIQQLFTTGKTIVYDHHSSGHARVNAYRIAKNRLLAEHHTGNMKFNDVTLTIEINNFNSGEYLTGN